MHRGSAVLAGWVVASLVSGATQGGPAVIWSSSSAGPGETVMLFGDQLGAKSRATAWAAPHDTPTWPGPTPAPAGDRVDLEVRARSRSDCLMVGLPSDFKRGVYVLCVRSDGATSNPIYVNRAQVTWWLGDGPESVWPGARVRLFGVHLVLGTTGKTAARSRSVPKGYGGKVVLVDAKGARHVLEIKRADKYTLCAVVPTDVATGQATLFVHNGHGGPWGWSPPVTVPVRTRTPWPTTEFNVRRFGAAGDGETDDTGAVRAALAKAAANKGGVVVVPRGTYKITGLLTVPERTVVRGQGRDTTRLYVPKDTPEFSSVFAGHGDFAIEHLWVTAQTPRRLITAPDHPNMYRMPWGHPPPLDAQKGAARTASRAHHVRLRDLRLHHLRYAHRVGTLDKDPRRKETQGPATVALCGPAMDMQGCEVVSAGMPLRLMHSDRTRIVDNVLHVGRSGWYSLWNSRRMCFEGNHIVGRDMEASYGGLAGDTIDRVYLADNRFTGGFGCEREALTFDTPGRYPWVGPITGAGACTVAVDLGTSKPWQRDGFAGLGCLVIKGKGLGQLRRVVANTDHSLTVDRAWDVVPASGSAVAIRPYRTHVVVYRNYSEDTSVGVQLWAGGHAFIVDGNTSVRTGGLWGTAVHYTRHGQQPFLNCFFTQWLSNTIDQGFIYQQGPFLHATLGLMNRQGGSGPKPEATPILANVIRGNTVSDGTRIGLFYYGQGQCRAMMAAALCGTKPSAVPPGRATLIECNMISHAPVGIEIHPFFEDTLVRDNRFDAVGRPIKDRGEGLARRVAALQARSRQLRHRREPLVWYRFDKVGAAGVVANAAGPDFPARVVGPVAWVAGRVGRGARLDGASYLVVGRPDDAAEAVLLNMSRFTLACWIKPDTIQGRLGLMAKRLRPALAPYVLSLWDGALAFDAADPKGDWPFNTRVGTCVKPKEWQHVAITVDEREGVVFYVNGQRRHARRFNGTLCRNAEPLVIGREVWGGHPPEGHTPGLYKGVIDEVKVWARVLAPDEVAAEWRSDR